MFADRPGGRAVASFNWRRRDRHGHHRTARCRAFGLFGNLGVTDRETPGEFQRENAVKHFAISTLLAGGLFAGLLGAAGAAHATAASDLVAPLATAATVMPNEEGAPCIFRCVTLNGQPIGMPTYSACKNSSPLGLTCYDDSGSTEDFD